MKLHQNHAIVTGVLRHDPRVALHLGLGFLEYWKAAKFDYNLSSGKAWHIPLITINITPLCNLRCLMCGQRGVKGTMKGEKAVQEARNLVPFERYKSFVDEIRGKVKIVYIWGGDPFLYPKFMDVAAYFSKHMPGLSVNTNGTFLAENAERIVADGWGGIFISLDGFEDTNDAIRGKGSYRKVIEGIKAITREKERQKSSRPYMGIVTTVSNMNYMYLDKMEEALGGIGLAWHIINLGTYMNEKIGREQTEFYEKHFGITPAYWQGFASGFHEGIDGDKFAEILDRVHRINNGYPVITVPVIDPKKIGTYYSDLDMVVRDRCAVPWFSANINYNGDVHFCADYPDYVIGNIKDDNLFDIFKGEKARKFRQVLRQSPDGLFPACKRCYQIMLCGRRRKGF